MLDIISALLPLNVIIISIFLAFYTFRYIARSFKYWEVQGIPYAQPIPCFIKFLNAMVFRISLGDFLTEFYREMKETPYFGIWVFGTPHLIVKDPELIKNVLLKDFDYFHNRTTFNDKSIDPISSKLLFFERMPDWASSRKILTVAFSSAKLKATIPLINNCGLQMIRYITKELDNGKTNIFEAKDMCSKFSVAVISSCAFGLDACCFENEDSKFLECSREMFGMDLENAIRSLSYFFLHSIVSTFRLKFAKPKIYNFLTKAFNETIAVRENSGSSRGDLIDVLIKIKQNDKLNGVSTDTNKLLAHAVQFFIAGSETTSSTISFTLYEMALDHHMQHKLRKDIETSLKQYGGPTYEALKEMKYLSMCISGNTNIELNIHLKLNYLQAVNQFLETLRKYPVLPFLDRRCVRDYQIPGSSGRVIKSGTPVYIPMFGLHYDPKYFPNPDKYDPERFSPSSEEQQQRHPFSYLPFGQGPHNCIGERFGLISTKLGLIHILTNFQVDRCATTPEPIVFDPKSFLLMSVNGLPVTLTKLKK